MDSIAPSNNEGALPEMAVALGAASLRRIDGLIAYWESPASKSWK
jgi:hypothetical protein